MSTAIEKGKKINKRGVSSRENKLFIVVCLQSILILTLIIGVFIFLYLRTLTPSVPIVVDSASGELLGEYRTTAVRTDEEVKAAVKKFIACDLSYNSQRIFDDLSCSISMMSEKLAQNRIRYLQANNIAQRIAKLNITSKIESIDTVINRRISGEIEVTTQGVIRFGAGTSRPFRQDITLQQIRISKKNTAGVIVVARKEYAGYDLQQFIESYKKKSGKK